MSEATRGRGLLEGAMEWLARVPSALSGQLTMDMARRRVRLTHPRVEAVTRKLLGGVRHLELGDWATLPHAYDVRVAAAGWRLRVEVVLERVELARGRYHVTLRTPGRVDLEEAKVASALMQGVLRMGGGTGALRAVLDKVLPEGLRWDGQRLQASGALPAEGVVNARLFENTSLVMTAEHTPEGLWLAAEAWPGLVDLIHGVLGLELPRAPPGESRP